MTQEKCPRCGSTCRDLFLMPCNDDYWEKTHGADAFHYAKRLPAIDRMKKVCKKHNIRFAKHCPACRLETFLNSPDENGSIPPVLHAIADTVLAYRPKSKRKKPRKRKKARKA